MPGLIDTYTQCHIRAQQLAGLPCHQERSLRGRSAFRSRLLSFLLLFIVHLLLPSPASSQPKRHRHVSVVLAEAASVAFNESFWVYPTRSFPSPSLGTGHYTRCPFETGVLERAMINVRSSVGANRVPLGDTMTPLLAVINNMDARSGAVTQFDGCVNVLGSFSTVIDEGAPAGAQQPQSIQCAAPLVVSESERAVMFGSVAAALRRLEGLLGSVPFDKRRTPVTLQPSEHSCRLSTIFERSIRFGSLDANLAVIVSAVPMPQSNRDGTGYWRDVLSWALPCAFDARDRPIVVRINFNPIKLRRMIEGGQLTAIVADTFHQLLHGVGFGGSNATSARLPMHPTGDIVGKAGVPYWSDVPAGFMQRHYTCADNATRLYFDDQQLTPLPLRPSKGHASHWEPRVVSRDVMASGRGAMLSVSAATLAYFATYYKGVYSLGADHSAIRNASAVYTIAVSPLGVNTSSLLWSNLPMPFRAVLANLTNYIALTTVLPTTGAGCGVHSEYCDTVAGGRGELFCSPRSPSNAWDSNIVCRRDRLGLTGCQIQQYNATLWKSPFGSAGLGGFSPQSDLCAYANGTAGGTLAAEDTFFSCSGASTWLPERSGSSFGSSSRCYDSDLMRFSSKNIPFGARCFVTRCHLGVVVEVMVSSMEGDTFVSCPRDGSAGSVSIVLPTHSGNLACPSSSTICSDPALAYIPFDISFASVPSVGGYPFELAMLPSAEVYGRAQAEDVCALLGSSVVSAVDWRILGMVPTDFIEAWVRLEPLFGFPSLSVSSISPSNSNCTLVSKQTQQITGADCTARAGVVCARRVPEVRTSPCAVGVPCLATNSETIPAVSHGIFIIPDQSPRRRVSAAEAVDVCGAYGAVPFSADIALVPTFLLLLRATMGVDATIPGLWTGFRSEDFSGSGLLSPGALSDGCVVISQMSPNSPLTMHATSCLAQFEVLCVVRDVITSGSIQVFEGSHLSIYRARVPRTYAAARTFCTTQGGTVAPLVTSQHEALIDAWLRRESSGGPSDVLSSAGRIPRRYWVGVRPFNVTPSLELLPTVSPNRFLPTATALGAFTFAVNETLFRNSEGVLVKAPSNGVGVDGVVDQSAPIAFFSCAMIPAVREADASVEGAVRLLLKTPPLGFFPAQEQCTDEKGGAPSYRRTSLFAPLHQPTAQDLLGLRGPPAVVVEALAGQARRAFGATGLRLSWTGLVYLPQQDQVAIYGRVGSGGSASAYTLLTDAQMASLRTSGVWPSNGAMGRYNSNEVGGTSPQSYLCVVLELRTDGTVQLGTNPCAMPLPIICTEDVAFYGDFTVVKSTTPNTPVEEAFSQIGCGYYATAVTHGRAAEVCGLIGGGLLQLALHADVAANGTFNAMDLFGPQSPFPLQSRFWMGATSVSTAPLPARVAYGQTAAPFYMRAFWEQWSSGGVGGSSCYTAMINDVTRHTDAFSQSCDDVYPFVCCVNVPRVTYSVDGPSTFRSGESLALTFTVPRGANMLPNATLGVTIYLNMSAATNTSALGLYSLAIRYASPLQLTRNSAADAYRASILLPTAEGAACLAFPCAPLSYVGGVVRIHAEGRFIMTVDFKSDDTRALGIDGGRTLPPEGLAVEFYRCPTVELFAPQRHMLCGVAVGGDHTVSVRLNTTGPATTQSLRFFLSTNSSCLDEPSQLGAAVVTATRQSTISQTTTAGSNSATIGLTVRLSMAVFGAGLCVVREGSCPCCGARELLARVSSYYAAANTSVLFSLSRPSNTTALGGVSAIRGAQLSFVPGLWQFAPVPQLNVSLVTARGARALPSSVTFPGAQSLSIAGEALGTFSFGAVVRSASGYAITHRTLECYANVNGSRYLPLEEGSQLADGTIANEYGVDNATFGFAPTIQLVFFLFDSNGHARTQYYPGEALSLRVDVITSLSRSEVQALLSSLSIDSLLFRVLPCDLLTMRNGGRMDGRIDIVQSLRGVVGGSGSLGFEMALRAINSTRAAVADGVLSSTVEGGLALSSSPDTLRQDLWLGGYLWELSGAITSRLSDVSVVQRLTVRVDGIPTRIIVGVPVAIGFTMPQAPPINLGIVVGCARFIVQRDALVVGPSDAISPPDGEVLTRAAYMISLPTSNSAAVLEAGYTPIPLVCYVNYSTSAYEIDVANTSFVVSLYPRIIPNVHPYDNTLLIGNTVFVNFTVAIPTDSFYPAAQIALQEGQNASRGLRSVLVDITSRARERRYNFRISTTEFATPMSTVCITFGVLNSSFVESPQPQCFYIAPPVMVSAGDLESYSQPVGEGRSRQIVLSINSMPFSKAIEASLSCKVGVDSSNRSIAAFTPSNVRWDTSGPAGLSRVVTLTGRQAGAYCTVMINVTGGGEVQGLGVRQLYPQPILFVATEYVVIEPVTAFGKLFPGPTNARRVRLTIGRQPSAPITVQLVTDAPAGMFDVFPPTVTFFNESSDNRTREVRLLAHYGAPTPTTYHLWGNLVTTASEFVQYLPKDGVPQTYVQFESERIYNISVLSPSAPSRGHITDTAVYCGGLEAATSLIYSSPHAPLTATDRVFLGLANVANAYPQSSIRLYTNPAVTIFTTSTGLESSFLLACDAATFPLDIKNTIVPVEMRLEGPGEFGTEGLFFVELRRLETIALAVDSVATVASSRIYLDVTLSSPVTAGKELRLSLVTSCGPSVTLQGGELVLSFAATEQQRSTRLIAVAPAMGGCNVTIVQTSDSLATNFERFSQTRTIHIFAQARVILLGEVIPDIITDLSRYLANRRERAFSIPQLDARNGFTLTFEIDGNSVSRGALRVERLATGISATTSIAITSNLANSEYLRTLMSSGAVSAAALPADPTHPVSLVNPTTTRFTVTFAPVPTPTSVEMLSANEELTLVFSRYLLARNDTEPAVGFSNYTIKITPQEVSIVGVQRSAVSAAAIIATVLSPFSGPSLAPHFSRVFVLIDIGQCPTTNWEARKQANIDLFANPIQLSRFGDASSMSAYLMAVIMNLVFAVILLALHGLLVTIIFASRINVLSSNKSILAAMQRARFPGASVFALGYFAGFNTEFGLRTMIYSEEGLYLGLGIVFFIVSMAATVYVFYHVYSRRFLRFDRSEDSQSVSWYRRIFDARGAWSPKGEALTAAATLSDREKIMFFHDRYGSIFTQFISPWQYYLSVDVGFSIVISAINAYEPRSIDGCLTKAIILAVVFALSAIILLVMRPYVYHMYNLFFVAISLFEVVSVGLSVAAASGIGGTFGLRAATISMLVVTNTLLLKLGVDLFLLVQTFVLQKMAKARDEEDVVAVGPSTGKVPYTDFGSVNWWGDHFGDVTASGRGAQRGARLQAPLLQAPSREEDDVMMCDLDEHID